MVKKQTAIFNGKEYRRGRMTYISKERAQGYAKLLREKGMNVILDKFKEKSQFSKISITNHFYWIGKKKKRGK